MAENLLLRDIIQQEDLHWRGEILIVKCNAAGQPVNVTDDDQCLVPGLLQR